MKIVAFSASAAAVALVLIGIWTEYTWQALLSALVLGFVAMLAGGAQIRAQKERDR